MSKFCNKCGLENEDWVAFCPVCGSQNFAAESDLSVAVDQADTDAVLSVPTDSTDSPDESQEPAEAPKFWGMRFHWFWSNIAMIFGILSGLSILGQAYEQIEVISSTYRWAVYFDMFFGSIYAIVCLCTFINRKKRTVFQWYSLLTPLLLRALYQITCLAFYSKWNLDTSGLAAQFIMTLVLGGCIVSYYGNRRFLFNEEIHAHL